MVLMPVMHSALQVPVVHLIDVYVVTLLLLTFFLLPVGPSSIVRACHTMSRVSIL